MRKTLLHLNHTLIKSIVNKNSIVLDMTLGHGKDSLFIAPYVSHVYGFDIQKKAIESAKETLKHVLNVTIIHDSFYSYASYVTSCDLCMFNLGYLPKHDKSITTRSDETIQAIDSLIKNIPDAHIVILCYKGHDEGLLEYEALELFCQTLESHYVLKTELMKFELAPVMYWIYKK